MRFAALSGSRFSGRDSEMANVETVDRSAFSASKARRPCSSVTCSAITLKPLTADLAADFADGLARDRACFAAAFFARFTTISVLRRRSRMLGQPRRIANRKPSAAQEPRSLDVVAATRVYAPAHVRCYRWPVIT